MQTLRTALICCILAGMIGPAWAGHSNSSPSRSSSSSFGSSGRSSSFSSSGGGWSSGNKSNSGSLNRSGNSYSNKSYSTPPSSKTFSSGSSGWSTSMTKPSPTVSTPSPQPKNRAEQIITQRSKIAGNQMNRGDARTQQALKYPTTFRSEPAKRPAYIPQSTVYSGHSYPVVYNPLYEGYGFYVGGLWSPYVYAPPTPIVVQQRPVVYQDGGSTSVAIVLWLIAAGLVVGATIYVMRKIRHGL